MVASIYLKEVITIYSSNVLHAARKRLRFIFSEFDHVYFSFSGGKDSGVMLMLAEEIAKEMNRRFDVLILDIEANYTDTVRFIDRVKQLSCIHKIFHFCLPFYEDNNSSIFQPQWIMWNPEEEDKWIQPMPEDAITLEKLDDRLLKLFFKCDGNPDKFLQYFSNWYHEVHNFESIACGIGLRMDESLVRYTAIKHGRNKYKKRPWINRYIPGIYKFYPIFDWKFDDIWAAVYQFNWDYNKVYDRMYKIGTPFRKMRICQPFGLHQRIGLEQIAKIEPLIWERVVNRVSGANFGSLYSKTSLLGYSKTKKPAHMSWQEYVIFLLESYGLYTPILRDHYYRKFKILMAYYEKNFQMTIDDIPEEASKKEWEKNERLWHNWKALARVLEKNDFALVTRQYSLTKIDEQELYHLYDEFQGALGIQSLNGKVYKKIIHNLLNPSS